MDLAIIIVSWNTRHLLEGCLASVQASLAASDQAGEPLTAVTWVVDNHSRDDTPEMVRREFPQVTLVANQENKGFAAANNQALEAILPAEPRYLLLLNPDTEVRGRALETLVRFLNQTPGAGLAGARLIYPDGSFQHSGFAFPGLLQIVFDLFPLPARLHEARLNGRYPRGSYAAAAPPFAIDHPLGAAMMVRRQAIEAVGLMDPAFHMYCEEIDWAMRMDRAGWRAYCVPSAEIVHHAGQSTSQVRAQSLVNLWRSRHHLYRKHYHPAKVRLAGWIVRLGMAYRARHAQSAELATAYRQASAVWTRS